MLSIFDIGLVCKVCAIDERDNSMGAKIVNMNFGMLLIFMSVQVSILAQALPLTTTAWRSGGSLCYCC